MYGLLTLKGTRKPTHDEILDSKYREKIKTRTDVMELHTQNSTNQSAVTRTFIYHDTYFDFTDLEEETDYVFFYFIEDLSKNRIDV